jgi:hypothetical protein
MIDVGTFGKTKAAVVLNAMLIEARDEGLTRQIGRLLGRALDDFKQLSAMLMDRPLRVRLAQLLRDHYLGVIDRKEIPERYKSYMKNIIITRCKLIVRASRMSY